MFLEVGFGELIINKITIFFFREGMFYWRRLVISNLVFKVFIRIIKEEFTVLGE